MLPFLYMALSMFPGGGNILVVFGLLKGHQARGLEVLS
jgi:hypothetical protein